MFPWVNKIECKPLSLFQSCLIIDLKTAKNNFVKIVLVALFNQIVKKTNISSIYVSGKVTFFTLNQLSSQIEIPF
jgi:hypothetical protein